MDTLSAPARVRRPAVSLWSLRLLLSLHLAAVLCQPVLAGIYLTGDVDAITVHGAVGTLVAFIGMAVAVLSIAYVAGGRGRLWVLPVGVGLFLVDGFQVGMGYARVLAVHVPLGVAVVVAAVLLAAWVWTPSAGRPRGAR